MVENLTDRDQRRGLGPQDARTQGDCCAAQLLRLLHLRGTPASFRPDRQQKAARRGGQPLQRSAQRDGRAARIQQQKFGIGGVPGQFRKANRRKEFRKARSPGLLRCAFGDLSPARQPILEPVGRNVRHAALRANRQESAGACFRAMLNDLLELVAFAQRLSDDDGDRRFRRQEDLPLDLRQSLCLIDAYENRLIGVS